MKVLLAILLALLLCRQPGRGQAQDEDDEEHGYDDEGDDDDEEYEAGQLECYSCQSSHREEGCNQTKSCQLNQTFCKILIYQENTESGPLTTYSTWCADTCEPVTRMIGETLLNMTCCQTTLCNMPPWQGTKDNGAEDHQGSPGTVAAALLLSLLTGIRALGS